MTKKERYNKLSKKRFKHELRKRRKEPLALFDWEEKYSPSRLAMTKPKKEKKKK